MALQRATVFKVEIEDVPGALLGLMPGLAEKGVNLLNLGAFSAGGGKGAAYCIADKPDELKIFADENGIVTEELAGFLLDGLDEVGAGATIFKRVADAGVNMVLATATVVEGKYYLLIAVNEADAAAAAEVL